MSRPSARSLAWEALQAMERGVALETSLSQALGQIEEPRERALLAELVAGATRWRGRYDHIIDLFAKQPHKVQIDVRIILRLGLHQLIACDQIPDYAAVDQSVKLIRSRKESRQAGFVNGVLQSFRRRAGATAEERLEKLPSLFPAADDHLVEYLAAWTSHPRWLVERWVRNFGEADATRICTVNNEVPALWFHVLAPFDAETARQDLADAGWNCEPGADPRSLRSLERVPRAQLVELLASRPHLIVQDHTVQEATSFLMTGIEGPVLDLCAAPGGKTLHMRADRPVDELFVALDQGERRLGPLRQNLERVEPNPISVLSADGRQAPFVAESFGAVLLDGPCSGTGVLRHHPEGRWQLTEASLDRNAETLLALAKEAVRVLRPGGTLLYATCSLDPEENQNVVEQLLSVCPDVRPVVATENHPSDRSWQPQTNGGDGFFATRLHKET